MSTIIAPSAPEQSQATSGSTQRPRLMHYINQGRFDSAVLDGGTVLGLCGHEWRPQISDSRSVTEKPGVDYVICQLCAAISGYLYGHKK